MPSPTAPIGLLLLPPSPHASVDANFIHGAIFPEARHFHAEPPPPCRLGVLWLGESRNSVLGILVLEKPTLKEEEGEDGRSKGGHKDRASRAAIAKSN